MSGGLTVSGRVPKGPGIVVANHTSHGDTAIMFASLPPKARPFAVAAADYWLTKWYKALAVKTLVSIVPVVRGESGSDAYADLLNTVRARIQRGGLVIIYPEGTRTEDGEVGDFKSGAVRLASDLQVPIYPAGILGISKVLPKNGSWRKAPMEVAFGEAVIIEASVGREEAKEHASKLRSKVVRLKGDDEPAEFVSRKFKKVVMKTAGWRLFALALVWGITEAISWPLFAETCLLFLAIVTPKRAMPAAFFLTLGSAVGVVAMTAMTFHGINAPMPLTTSKMLAHATSDMQVGPEKLSGQLVSGVPIKVYARAAGSIAQERDETPPYGELFLYSFLYRGIRIGGIGLLVTAIGWVARNKIKKHYTFLFYSGLIAFAMALSLVVSKWQ